MSLTCFNSSDPNAPNTTLMYDSNLDSGTLWEGQAPLPPCPSTSLNSTIQCVVCTAKQMVHAVCRNLAENATVMMEAEGHHVDITESDCPQLLDPAGLAGSSGEHGDLLKIWLPILIIILMISISIFIFLVVHFKPWKRCKAPEQQTRSENGVSMRMLPPGSAI